MKKILSLVMACSIAFISLAAPWDIKSSPQGKVDVTKPLGRSFFDAPTLTDYTVAEQAVPHRIVIYYKFNKAATYTQLMTVMVYGYWADIADYEPRTWDIYIPPGQTENTWYHNLATGDDLIPEVYDIYYLGPDPGAGLNR